MRVFIAIFAVWLILLTTIVFVGFGNLLPSDEMGQPDIIRDDPELESGFVGRLESDCGLRLEGE